MNKYIFEYERTLRSIVRRHEKKSVSQSKIFNANNANEEIYDAFIDVLRISRALDGLLDPMIVSLRGRRGSKASALRSIFSFPKDIYRIVADIDSPKSYSDVSTLDFSVSAYDNSGFQHYHENTTNDNVLIEKYDLSELVNNEYPENSPLFPARINHFLKTMSQKKQKKLLTKRDVDVDELKMNGICWVISKVSQKKELKEKDKINELVALYFTKNREKENNDLTADFSRSFLNEFGMLLLLTFSAFEDIEKQDLLIFRRQAFSVINDNLPNFMRKENAPAENVKKILVELESICRLHPSMGCSTLIDDVTVRFIQIEFQKLKRQGEKDVTILPKQNIYPPHFAKNLEKDAFIFSHRHSRTVTKHLMGKWSLLNNWAVKYPEEEEIKIHQDFKDTYEDHENTDSFGHWIYDDKQNKDLKGIYATSINEKGNDNIFWKTHSFPSNENNAKQNHTTAAFFMINRHDNEDCDFTELPFGILAFESTEPDAFSKKDLRVLQDVSDAMSRLLVVSNFSNSNIDYGSKLRDAIVKYKYSGNRVFGEFVFELLRIDKGVFERLLDKNEETTWDAYELMVKEKNTERSSREIFQNAFAELLQGCPKDWNNKLEDWLNENQDKLKELWCASDDSQLLLDLLESIPSNIKWHSRLNAIPRALNNRKVRSPTLKRFPTGFSADAIYILDEGGEIRQVLKFSSDKDISKEINAYKRFVRYNVPLAARIPSDGFAIETDGNYEDNNKGFGVLVSDLVAGQKDGGDNGNEHPKSLADLLVGGIEQEPWSGGDGKERLKEYIDTSLEAIVHHFSENTVRWNSPGKKDSFKLSYDNWLNSVDENYSLVVNSSSRMCEMEQDFEGGKVTVINEDKLISFYGKKPIDDSNKEFLIRHGAILVRLMKGLDRVLIKSVRKFIKKQKHVSNDLKQNYKFNFSGFKKNDDFEKIISNWLDSLDVLNDDPVNLTDFISIIHGDLNPQNLTWSSSYTKFQLIDFEHVKYGLRGSDHLKLMFSILYNTQQRFLEKNHETVDLPFLAENIESAINVIFAFASCMKKYERVRSKERILRSHVSKRVFNLDEQDIPLRYEDYDNSLYLARVFKVIIHSLFTIAPAADIQEIHTLKSPTIDRYRDLVSKDFIMLTKTALRSFALKEFSYALRGLRQNDYERIEYWADKIENKKDMDIGKLLSSLGKDEDEDDNGNNKDINTAALFNTYLAFRAVCAGLGDIE